MIRFSAFKKHVPHVFAVITLVSSATAMANPPAPVITKLNCAALNVRATQEFQDLTAIYNQTVKPAISSEAAALTALRQGIWNHKTQAAYLRETTRRTDDCRVNPNCAKQPDLEQAYQSLRASMGITSTGVGTPYTQYAAKYCEKDTSHVDRENFFVTDSCMAKATGKTPPQYTVNRYLTLGVKDFKTCVVVERVQLRPQVFADISDCSDIRMQGGAASHIPGFEIRIHVTAPTDDMAQSGAPMTERAESVFADARTQDPQHSGLQSYLSAVTPPQCTGSDTSHFPWAVEPLPPDAQGYTHYGYSKNLVEALAQPGQGPLLQAGQVKAPAAHTAQ